MSKSKFHISPRAPRLHRVPDAIDRDPGRRQPNCRDRQNCRHISLGLTSVGCQITPSSTPGPAATTPQLCARSLATIPEADRQPPQSHEATPLRTSPSITAEAWTQPESGQFIPRSGGRNRHISTLSLELLSTGSHSTFITQVAVDRPLEPSQREGSADLIKAVYLQASRSAQHPWVCRVVREVLTQLDVAPYGRLDATSTCDTGWYRSFVLFCFLL